MIRTSVRLSGASAVPLRHSAGVFGRRRFHPAMTWCTLPAFAVMSCTQRSAWVELSRRAKSQACSRACQRSRMSQRNCYMRKQPDAWRSQIRTLQRRRSLESQLLQPRPMIAASLLERFLPGSQPGQPLRPVAGFPMTKKNWIAGRPGFFAPCWSSRAFSASVHGMTAPLHASCAARPSQPSSVTYPAKNFFGAAAIRYGRPHPGR